jgi:4a-hydroxytetrahydrobiopterin dehydratase
MSRLSDQEVHERLGKLQGWERDGDRIRKQWRFAGFAQAMGFVNRVAELAEAMNHHPDFLIHYDRVTLTLWSHDTGGLTARDFRLAQGIDALQAA